MSLSPSVVRGNICRNLQNLLKPTPAIPANPHLKSLVALLCMYAMRDEMGLGDLRLGARSLTCPCSRRGKRSVVNVKLGEGSGFWRIEFGSGCIECK